MPALDPLDVSAYTAGTYLHTFTINVSTLPPGVYDVLVFAWPDANFNEDYYLKEMALDDQKIICLCGGTLVATPEGERPVETLAPGDLVITSDGRAVPVRFVGVQRVSPRFSRDGEAVPVRITAGALGGGLPRRDLLVSRRHAIYIGGTLVNAGALVNGTTIRYETPAAEFVAYYCIETERHELLLAEGVPVESFLDAVPRTLWQNYAAYEAAYPDAPAIEELPYPRASSARQVPQAVRRIIAAQAAERALQAA
ncbi:MAG: Hint domain-containing protein [Elioraea sp.]|nr:Hint domain-containing protein [Elioraea sp.]